MSQELVDRAMDAHRLANVIIMGKVGPAVAEAVPHLHLAAECFGQALRSQQRAEVLLELGQLYERLNDQANAVPVYEEAEKIFNELGEFQQVARAAVMNGLAAKTIGKADAALAHLKRALELQRKGDLTDVARTSLLIGDVYQDLGKASEALTHYQEALTIFTRFNRRSEIAYAHQMIALAHKLAGNHAEMLKHFETSISMRENLGDMKGAAMAISKLADMQRQNGNADLALASYNRCLNIHKMRNDLALIAQTVGNIGTVYSLRGAHQEALDNYSRCVELSDQAGEKATAAQALYNMACVHVTLGHPDDAIIILERALDVSTEAGVLNLSDRVCAALVEIFEQKEDKTQLLAYQRKRAEVLEQLGNHPELLPVLDQLNEDSLDRGAWDDAIEFQKRALHACRNQASQEAAERHYSLGLLYGKRAQHDLAANAFAQAQLRFANLGMDLQEADSLRHLGSAELNLGASSDARSHFSKSLQLYEKINDKRNQAKVLVGIGNAHAQLQAKEEAIAAFNRAADLYSDIGDVEGTATIRKATNQLK
jgi:tetratricopeptide (TPR) repeat protein